MNRLPVIFREVFERAVASASSAIVPGGNRSSEGGRCVMLAVGKAAHVMAASAAEHWTVTEGLVIVPKGASQPNSPPWPVIEAGHPLPDIASFEAGAAALRMAQSIGKGDTLLVLISGGASALMEKPGIGFDQQEVVQINETLLRSGLSIAEMNTLRRRASAIKGGRLALEAAPARVVTYALSDVPGDIIADVGSGPTVARADEPAVTWNRLTALPARLRERLKAEEARPPTPSHPLLQSGEAYLIASPVQMLAAVEELLRERGYAVENMGLIDGDAAHVGRAHARLALELLEACSQPTAILSGGETTVEVNGAGRGGRNKHYLLALASEVAGHVGISAFAADTDGIDGTQEDAGAWFGPETFEHGSEQYAHLNSALKDCRSYDVFVNVGTLFICGPTGTNVNDLRVVLVDPPTIGAQY